MNQIVKILSKVNRCGEWGSGEVGGQFFLSITDYRLPITDYRLPITDYPFPSP
ncbi:hypothetical protein [Tolypothrix sp. NIES-4075]|uniref:hypothetical protein n=1 Tax=Tolypothrix sp. NIES-4075 TaxID=2005459 RepID=UPI001F36F955|nr:hypothetical protein [Tolypothrix sp. NIES-4075]